MDVGPIEFCILITNDSGKEWMFWVLIIILIQLKDKKYIFLYQRPNLTHGLSSSTQCCHVVKIERKKFDKKNIKKKKERN